MMWKAIRNVIWGDQLFAVFVGNLPIYPFRWCIEDIKERLSR